MVASLRPKGTLALGLLAWMAACGVAAAGGPAEEVSLPGKVVTLAEALKARGLPADPEPAGRQVVLLGADSSVTPLIPDEASRALLLDDRLRGRPAMVRGRRLPGLPFVQVVNFQVEEEGRLRTPEYYCNICTISVRSPQDCPCCQGPMELRMKPERP